MAPRQGGNAGLRELVMSGYESRHRRGGSIEPQAAPAGACQLQNRRLGCARRDQSNHMLVLATRSRSNPSSGRAMIRRRCGRGMHAGIPAGYQPGVIGGRFRAGWVTRAQISPQVWPPAATLNPAPPSRTRWTVGHSVSTRTPSATINEAPRRALPVDPMAFPPLDQTAPVRPAADPETAFPPVDQTAPVRPAADPETGFPPVDPSPGRPAADPEMAFP